MVPKLTRAAAGGLVAAALAGCAAAAATPAVWQLSAFAVLARGGYDGVLTVAEVRRHGDVGLGAADGLNGEMVVVDGRFYQFLADGRVVVPPDSMRVPFAAVTFWKGGRDVPARPGLRYGSSFDAAVDSLLPSADAFYVLRMEGTWDVVVARTFSPPGRPYPPLRGVAADTFTLESARGTMVGFRQPSYADPLSIPGYHLHFIDAERARGGHVLGFTTRDVRLQVSERPDFTVRTPPAGPAAPGGR
ncbi:MAG TPA: acetolactate decarboxylase [Longimicrobium sp.]|nr:acetolactate decarboxylase [Longimicrobium sp.]